MDCGGSYGSLHVIDSLSGAGGNLLGFGKVGGRSVVGNSRCPIGLSVEFQGTAWFQGRQLSLSRRRSSFVITATSAESNRCKFKNIRSPLQPHSPAGEFLSSTLRNQPQFFHVAAHKLLQELELEKKSAIARQECGDGTSEACLHKRIAELKELECQIAVEEVIYLLIIENFLKLKVPMSPRLPKTFTGTFEVWPSKEKELESIHLPEVLELVKEHLTNIVSREGRHGHWSRAQIKRLQLGRLYAASILYGYFLKSACLRHQLEDCLARTDEQYPFGCTICVPHLERQMSNLEENLVVVGRPFDAVASFSPGLHLGRKPRQLRSYLMEFDPDAIQLCAKIRSQEATNIIENHSLAIFGDGNLATLENGDAVSVSFWGMRRLMLEAVAFGTFLWDAERLVDPIYQLKESHLEVKK